MSACLFTKVKWQWATLVMGWVTASVHSVSDGFAACTKPLSALLINIFDIPVYTNIQKLILQIESRSEKEKTT